MSKALSFKEFSEIVNYISEKRSMPNNEVGYPYVKYIDLVFLDFRNEMDTRLRKLDLIKKLQQLKGNPEVMLWNGIVGDFAPIGRIVESDLVKVTKDYYIRTSELREAIELGDWNFALSTEEKAELTEEYNSMPYEYNSFVTSKDIKEKKYKVKKILAIDAKVTGKKSFDRLGEINY